MQFFIQAGLALTLAFTPAAHAERNEAPLPWANQSKKPQKADAKAEKQPQAQSPQKAVAQQAPQGSSSLVSARSLSTAQLFQTLTDVGPWPKQVVQAHAFDEQRGEFYTLQTSKTFVKGDEYAVISRFKLGGSSAPAAIDSSLPSNVVGHQGLAVQQDKSGVWLWSSAPSSKSTPGGANAVRFKYRPNGDVSDVQTFKLFDDNVDGVTTPTISSDGRLLIAKFTERNRGQQSNFRVRVFDLAAITAGGPGDYSKKFLHDWTTGDEVSAVSQGKGRAVALQTMASDGRSVLIFVGSANIDGQNFVGQYSMDGAVQGMNDRIGIGMDAAAEDGGGKHFEVESLAFVRMNGRLVLTWGIASGGGKDRTYRIWTTPYISGN